ncbi:MAG: exodeoxyribonuclease III [Bacteroides sp.]|nr:exodeoxyribonuclease III [Bacteroides sp.]
MKIVTYNVNGLRAALSKGLTEWITLENPDILCLQETKLQPNQYECSIFENIGYKSHLFSAEKKGYSGVAILSKKEPLSVEYGIGVSELDREGRVIKADYGTFAVVSAYHPSGSSGDERQDFKIQWLSSFRKYIDEQKKKHNNLIVCGDYNICHQAIDIHDPKRNANKPGFTDEERSWFSDFLDTGFVDSYRYLYPEKQEYTWWSYITNARARNKGWRIDYCLISKSLLPSLISARIASEVIHSDHFPVVVELKDL